MTTSPSPGRPPICLPQKPNISDGRPMTLHERDLALSHDARADAAITHPDDRPLVDRIMTPQLVARYILIAPDRARAGYLYYNGVGLTTDITQAHGFPTKQSAIEMRRQLIRIKGTRGPEARLYPFEHMAPRKDAAECNCHLIIGALTERIHQLENSTEYTNNGALTA